MIPYDDDLSTTDEHGFDPDDEFDWFNFDSDYVEFSDQDDE